MAKTMFLAGSYTQPVPGGTGKTLTAGEQGISLYALEGNRLHLRCEAASPNASYLTLNRARTRLYATNELQTWQGQSGGSVSAFALDPDAETLRKLNTVGTRGMDPCHVALSADEGTLYCANYTSGSVSVFPVGADGALEALSLLSRHEGHGADPARQEGPHAHGCFLSPGGGWLYVTDLGTDTIVCYRQDTGTHTLRRAPERDIHLPDPGEGVRHLAFHPGGGWLYAVTEMGNHIYTFRYDEARGEATAVQKLSTVPPGTARGASYAAAVKFHPNGQLLFVSNRGHNSLTACRADPETGLLRLLSIQPTGGDFPRDFALSPDGGMLAVAHQFSHDLRLFSLNQQSGEMTFVSQLDVQSPVCVRFFSVP